MMTNIYQSSTPWHNCDSIHHFSLECCSRRKLEEQQRSARKTRQSEECKGNRFTRILLTTTMVTTARASTTQWGQKLHKKAKFPYTACILTKYFLNILVLHI